MPSIDDDLTETKEAFIEALSHELRTPLTVLRGCAVTLERVESQRLTLPRAERLEILRALVDRSAQLEEMVTDLLELTRAKAGLRVAHKKPVELRSLVLRIAEQTQLYDRQLQIDARPVVVWADVAKIERMVECLLDNAVKHSEPDAAIAVRVRLEPQGACLIVEDSGPGIPEALREEVLEPFRHGPIRSQHSPGLGIGLSLVAVFAGLHGGRAWIEPGPGNGTRVRVLLPVEGPVSSEGGPSPASG